MPTDKEYILAQDLSIIVHPGPYPGLRSFSEDEPDLFFGRNRQIKDIIARLGKKHVAAILGGSGCGKSSLVRAGVIPELRTYGMPNRSDTWVPVTFTPNVAPITRLAEALNRSLTSCDDHEDSKRKENIRQILNEPRGFSSFFEEYKNELNIGQNFGECANLLILVDQFEEVFRPQNAALEQTQQQTQRLIKLIIDCFDYPNEQVFVLLTMRSEYLERCANYPKFADVLNEVSYLTRRLEKDELKEVIIQPARYYAAELTKPSVETLRNNPIWPFDESVKTDLMQAVEALGEDTDHLPLLQHYLFWLWREAHKRWDESGRREKFNITQDDMKKARGKDETDSLLKDCLNYQAQRIYDDSLTKMPNGQKISEKMFRLLAKEDDNGNYTRCWTDINEILSFSVDKSSKAKAAGVKKVSVQSPLVARASRLLKWWPRWPRSQEKAGGGERLQEKEIREQVLQPYMEPHEYLREEKLDNKANNIDVAHEALIRNWNQFKVWLRDEKVVMETYVMLLKETNKQIPLKSQDTITWKSSPKHIWKLIVKISNYLSSEGLLSDKEIKQIESCNILKLDPVFERRYNGECYDSLPFEERRSTEKSVYIENPEHYEWAKKYFDKSNSSLKIKEYVFVAIPYIILIVIIGSYLIYINIIDSINKNLEINLLQPYAVANSLKGNAIDEPEEKRLIRFQQLAVALLAIENLEREKFYSEKEKFYSKIFEDDEELGRLGRLDRLARSAAYGAVRGDLEALVQTSDKQQDYTRPSVDTEFKDYNPAYKKCVEQILDQSNKQHLDEKTSSLYIADHATSDWKPLVVRIVSENLSEYLFGVKINDEKCIFISSLSDRVPLSIESLKHDDSLKLMIYKPAVTDDRHQLFIARIHWYYDATKSSSDNNKPYKIDFRDLGHMDTNYTSGDIKPTFDDIKISPKRDGFSFVDENKNEKRYKIHADDSLEPVSQDEAVKYFKSNSNIVTNKDIDSCPAEIQATNNVFYFTQNALCYQNKNIYKTPDDEKNSVLTSFAVDDDNDNGDIAYLAFTEGNSLEKTSQTLTILLWDKRLLKRYSDDVKIEIGKFAFQRPKVTKIAFGKGDDKGWLFFATEAEQGQPAYYKTVFGVKQMRRLLCDIIKEYPKDSTHTKRIKDSISLTTPTFQVLKKNQVGYINTITNDDITNEDKGECTTQD